MRWIFKGSTALDQSGVPPYSHQTPIFRPAFQSFSIFEFHEKESPDHHPLPRCVDSHRDWHKGMANRFAHFRRQKI